MAISKIYKLLSVALLVVFPTISNAKVITIHEYRCLIKNIYYESRGESLLGQRAVARVTLNRKNDYRFPNNICDVVFQKNQFSWTNHKYTKINDTASMAVALMAIINHNLKYDDPSKGSLFFHNKTVNPNWNRTKTTTIGNHIFYK